MTGASSAPTAKALSILAGHRVVLWPDSDPPGRAHMERLRDRLVKSMLTTPDHINIIEWPNGTPKGYDCADLTVEQMKAIFARTFEATPKWTPADEVGPASVELANRASVLRVADAARERVSWLWPGRIPRGKLTVFDGDPGLAKSTVALDVAARLTTGRAMPGEAAATVPPMAVLVLSAEDGVGDTIRPRLEAAGADLERVHVLERVDDRLPTLPDDVAVIREQVKHLDVGLVVLDPLMAFLAGRVDSHRDQDVRGALAQVADLAAGTGAAVLAIRHLNKGASGNALYRGGGSIAIIGAARSGLAVAKDPEDPERRILASTKSNLGPPPASLVYELVADDALGVARVEWLGASLLSAADLLGVAAQDSKSGAAEDFLRALLASGPVSSSEVEKQAKAAGISPRTVWRAKQRLGVRAHRIGFGSVGVWYWELPDDHDDAAADPKAATTPKVASNEGLAAYGEKQPESPILPKAAIGRERDGSLISGALSDYRVGDRLPNGRVVLEMDEHGPSVLGNAPVGADDGLRI